MKFLKNYPILFIYILGFTSLSYGSELIKTKVERTAQTLAKKTTSHNSIKSNIPARFFKITDEGIYLEAPIQ